jgi:hypothetical protein
MDVMRPTRNGDSARCWQIWRWVGLAWIVALGMLDRLGLVKRLTHSQFARIFGGGLAILGAYAVLLLHFDYRRPFKPGHCHRCGYDLRGIRDRSQGQCPECGAGFPVSGPSIDELTDALKAKDDDHKVGG